MVALSHTVANCCAVHTTLPFGKLTVGCQGGVKPATVPLSKRSHASLSGPLHWQVDGYAFSHNGQSTTGLLATVAMDASRLAWVGEKQREGANLHPLPLRVPYALAAALRARFSARFETGAASTTGASTVMLAVSSTTSVVGPMPVFHASLRPVA